MMFQQLVFVVLAIISLITRMDNEFALAFQSVSIVLSPRQHGRTVTGYNSNMALYGLLGRLRKKRKVDQVSTIKVGDVLPVGVDVERLIKSSEGTTGGVLSEPVSIQDVLGPNKAILIGMPGAFTTTCSTEHLPGYVQSAKKLQSLGIDTIAVVTTNDRFVNQEWSAQQGLVTTADSTGSSPTITMLCDADGDFVKSIGLAEDMGFGVGVRSKRFTMIIENGVVKTLLTDDGMDDCTSTSAANVVKLLTPDPAPGSSDSAVEIDGKLILGAAGVGLLAILTVFMGGNDGASTSSVPKSSNAPQNRIVPQKSSSDTNFSLLNEYIKK